MSVPRDIFTTTISIKFLEQSLSPGISPGLVAGLVWCSSSDQFDFTPDWASRSFGRAKTLGATHPEANCSAGFFLVISNARPTGGNIVFITNKPCRKCFIGGICAGISWYFRCNKVSSLYVKHLRCFIKDRKRFWLQFKIEASAARLRTWAPVCHKSDALLAQPHWCLFKGTMSL